MKKLFSPFSFLLHCLYRVFLTLTNLTLYLFHPSLLLIELFLFFEEIIHSFYHFFTLFTSITIPHVVYGTLPFSSLHTLKQTLSISKNTTILDIGSGKGKLCLFFSLITGCRTIGVEACRYYYQIHRILNRLFCQHRRCSLYFQDIFDHVEHTDSNCDIVFIPALSFSDHQLTRLASQFIHTTSILVSVGAPLSLSQDYLSDRLILPCSWGMSPIYIYSPL